MRNMNNCSTALFTSSGGIRAFLQHTHEYLLILKYPCLPPGDVYSCLLFLFLLITLIALINRTELGVCGKTEMFEAGVRKRETSSFVLDRSQVRSAARPFRFLLLSLIHFNTSPSFSLPPSLPPSCSMPAACSPLLTPLQRTR